LAFNGRSSASACATVRGNEAIFCVGLTNAIGDDVDDDVIRGEFAPSNDILTPRAGLDGRLSISPVESWAIPNFSISPLRLNAFSSPRRAQQDQSHDLPAALAFWRILHTCHYW
jgi:hypothetical protein